MLASPHRNMRADKLKQRLRKTEKERDEYKRALELVCHTVFGYYEQDSDNPNYQEPKDFVKYYLDQARKEVD